MKKAFHLVSVIIPTYNRETLISKAIDSVINQSYENWELIIVDDRSTDNTEKLIKECYGSETRIRYVLNTRTKGPAGARNYGITVSKGDFIAFLDSDDEWTVEHLEYGMEVLLKHSNYNICFSLWYELVNNRLYKCDDLGLRKGRLDYAIRDLQLCSEGKVIFFNHEFYEYNLLNQVYCYHINTIIFRKTILNKTGMFDEALFSSEDMDFIYRLIYYFNFCLIRDYHFIYNQGTDNIYSFIDRNSIDLNNIIYDQSTVKRLTIIGENKNCMRKIRKTFVKHAHDIKCKREIIHDLNHMISKKYFTLGYLNSKIHRVSSFVYFTKSLIYEFKLEKLTYIIKLLSNYGSRNVVFDKSRLDLG